VAVPAIDSHSDEFHRFRGAPDRLGCTPAPVQQRAEVPHRLPQAPVRPAADQRGADVRGVQPHDHPHRCGLSENVRTSILVIGALIAVGAWLWMDLLISLRAVRAAATLIVGLARWLTGLGRSE
jgi:Flp pilus assembly protein TadB